MENHFHCLAATTTGTQHIRTGKNNQDAFSVQANRDFILAMVSDGCGSSNHSEVGAKLGLELIKSTITKLFPMLKSQQLSQAVMNAFFERVYRDTLSQIRVLANAMDHDIVRIISDYFLFTVVGFLVLPKYTIIFSIGDGLYMVNGNVQPLGPFVGNKPPYLSYGLFNPASVNMPTSQLQFQIDYFANTENLDSLMIGTDGILDLFDSNNDYRIVNQDRVAPISDIIDDESFFQNPDNLRRWLFLLNKEKRSIDWLKQESVYHPGLLKDDSTLIILKRKSK